LIHTYTCPRIKLIVLSSKTHLQCHLLLWSGLLPGQTNFLIMCQIFLFSLRHYSFISLATYQFGISPNDSFGNHVTYSLLLIFRMFRYSLYDKNASLLSAFCCYYPWFLFLAHMSSIHRRTAVKKERKKEKNAFLFLVCSRCRRKNVDAFTTNNQSNKCYWHSAKCVRCRASCDLNRGKRRIIVLFF
jgi:hypothetical protein